MKFCTHCGAEIADEAVVCTACGCPTETAPAVSATKSDSNILKTVAKIFMLIGCIGTAFVLIPLCWTIPMTVHYWKSVENKTPVGVGFKVCTLIFVSLIAGVLMLCDNEE